ncbi:MAG: efflux RND transporter periplasmic adaptor subunit [Bacteroidia bacterium]
MRKIVFILLGLLATGWVGYTLYSNKQKRNEAASKKVVLENVPVTVTKLNTQSIASSFSYIGNFMPNKEVAIGAETQGKIVQVFVKEGDYVKQGQVLAKVDDETLRLKLAAEEAALKNAQAGLSTAQSAYSAAQSGLVTAQTAFKNAQSGLGTARNGKQTTQNSKQIAQNSLKTAQAAKVNALAMLEKAKKDVTRFENLMKAEATTDMQLQNAKMGVIQAESAVNQADAAINQAEGALNQVDAGFNQTDGAITQAESGVNQAQGAIKQAEMGIKSAQMQIEQANFGIKTAETQIATTKKMLSNTNITSPISGVITMKNFEVGSMVGGGMPLGMVTDISFLKLTVMIPEADVLKFREGQEVKVSADVYQDVAYAGTITLISDKSDNAHAYKTEITLPNSTSNPLKAGMYGKLLGKEAGMVAGIFIPRNSIMGSIQEPKVYILSGNKAVLKPVTTGTTSGDLVEIKTGLQAGEQIITAGQINLEDGVTVKVVNTVSQ